MIEGEGQEKAKLPGSCRLSCPVYMFFHSACRATEKSGDQDSIMSRFSHASQLIGGMALVSWCSPDGGRGCGRVVPFRIGGTGGSVGS